MKSIAVFCGSSNGNSPIYLTSAYLLGSLLAQSEIEVIYGGAKIGMMGALADGALEQGGKVVGVIPDFLRSREIAHQGLSKLIIVETMHDRKLIMSELCEGVIAMPGGFGTMDEVFEMLTWGQLGLHQKPVALLNVNGYFDPLIQFIGKMTVEGLLKKENQEMVLFDNDPYRLLQKMDAYEPPTVGKWINKEQV